MYIQNERLTNYDNCSFVGQKEERVVRDEEGHESENDGKLLEEAGEIKLCSVLIW